MRELYNNSSVHTIISKDVSENMINHSYMFISNDKNFLHLLAKSVSMQLLCLENKPCFACNQCLKIEKNEHADVVMYPANNKKSIVTEDVDKIVSESYVMPLEGEKKIYVLLDFDLATIQAQNKLLKTLEEPPKSVVFILTTTNENNVLATIKSRCKKVVVPALTHEKLKAYLVRKYGESDKLDKIVDLSGGNLSIAENFLKNENMLKMQDLCDDIVNALNKSDQVLLYATRANEFSDETETLLNLLMETFSKVDKAIVNNDRSQYFIEKYNSNMLFEISKLINKAVMNLRANCNINTVIDGLLLGILEVRYRCQK